MFCMCLVLTAQYSVRIDIVNKDKLWYILRHYQIGHQTDYRATERGLHLHRETRLTVPETPSVAGSLLQSVSCGVLAERPLVVT